MDVQVEEFDKKIRQIIPEKTTLEQVATGFGFTEGPLWCGDYLLFSDIPRNRIVRLRMCSEGPEITTYRSPSGNSNGLTIDKSGRLIVCEHSGRRVTRTDVDGSVSVLAEQYDGQRLNSPNDVVVRSDGSIYFTDPSFGLVSPPMWKELSFNGVYRIAPDGELVLLANDFEMPNGLAFSPDESVLYVNDTTRNHIRAFDVSDNGNVSNGRVFVEMKGEEAGRPDGMKVDQQGNVYCTGPGGIWIMQPDGKCLGRMMMPEQPANFGWSDPDWKTLYITARTSIYRMRLLVQGITTL
ncbi:SMP-30/gluconolactonase/LRE family protein [Chloroflexota bacterium]